NHLCVLEHSEDLALQVAPLSATGSSDDENEPGVPEVVSVDLKGLPKVIVHDPHNNEADNGALEDINDLVEKNQYGASEPGAVSKPKAGCQH
ncbi:hypothetical protein A2U01_0057960, partial [Trifolium medium]|nr:hypothetical protein [Trifolium medium]